MKIVNMELLSNPMNWVVVYLMVAIAALAWGLVDPLNVNNNSQGSPP